MPRRDPNAYARERAAEQTAGGRYGSLGAGFRNADSDWEGPAETVTLGGIEYSRGTSFPELVAQAAALGINWSDVTQDPTIEDAEYGSLVPVEYQNALNGARASLYDTDDTMEVLGLFMGTVGAMFMPFLTGVEGGMWAGAEAAAGMSFPMAGEGAAYAGLTAGESMISPGLQNLAGRGGEMLGYGTQAPAPVSEGILSSGVQNAAEITAQAPLNASQQSLYDTANSWLDSGAPDWLSEERLLTPNEVSTQSPFQAQRVPAELPDQDWLRLGQSGASAPVTPTGLPSTTPRDMLGRLFTSDRLIPAAITGGLSLLGGMGAQSAAADAVERRAALERENVQARTSANSFRGILNTRPGADRQLRRADGSLVYGPTGLINSVRRG